MKRLILLCLLSLLAVANSHAATISEEFNRADSSDLGSNWDAGYSTLPSCGIVGNAAYSTAVGDVCWNTWNANTFTNNQWAQVTHSTFTSSEIGRIGLQLRSAPPASTLTTYSIKSRRGDPSASTKIFKYVADVQTTLATENSVVWATGDVLYAEISGTAITVKRNGVVILTATDSDLTSGRIGLEIDEGPDLGTTQADDFTGGDLPTATRRRVGPMAFQ